MPRVGDDGQWITTRPPPPPPQQAPAPGPPVTRRPLPRVAPPGPRYSARSHSRSARGQSPPRRPPASGSEWFERLESEQFLDEHTPLTAKAVSRSLTSHGAGGTVTSSTQFKPKPASSAARLSVSAQPSKPSGPASKHVLARDEQPSPHATALAPTPASQHAVAHRLAAFESRHAHPTAALTEHTHQSGRVVATATHATTPPPHDPVRPASKPPPARTLRPTIPARTDRPIAKPAPKPPTTAKLTPGERQLVQKLKHSSVGGIKIVNPLLTVEAAARAASSPAGCCSPRSGVIRRAQYLG